MEIHQSTGSNVFLERLNGYVGWINAEVAEVAEIEINQISGATVDAGSLFPFNLCNLCVLIWRNIENLWQAPSPLEMQTR